MLASPYLQAGVSIWSGYAVEVMGPIAEMQLTEAPAPRVELHTTGSVYAVVHESARSPIAGPLLYEPAGTSCKESAQGTEESFPGGIGWLETRRDQLNAVWPQGQSWHGQCTHDYEWHVIAGWVGMPVAHIDYSSATPPASLSTPTPLPSQASPDKSR